MSRPKTRAFAVEGDLPPGRDRQGPHARRLEPHRHRRWGQACSRVPWRSRPLPLPEEQRGPFGLAFRGEGAR